MIQRVEKEEWEWELYISEGGERNVYVRALPKSFSFRRLGTFSEEKNIVVDLLLSL